MPPLGTTNLSLPRLRLIELLAACPTLQTALVTYDVNGDPITVTPATCASRIYSPYADDHWVDNSDPTQGIVDPRPRVIVQHNDFSRQKLGTAYGGGEGSLFLTFEFPPDEDATSINEQLASFEETLGLVLGEMEDRVGQDKDPTEILYSDSSSTHLNVTRYQLIAGPASSLPEEELGELFYAAVFLIFYTG